MSARTASTRIFSSYVASWFLALLMVLGAAECGDVRADTLTLNTTPAERARGCSWAEDFDTEEAVQKNNGTLVGSPTVDFGITLDGSTQYAVYDLLGREFSSAGITIVCEFTPDFEHDDSAGHYLIDSQSGKRYLILKATSNTLQIYLGNTFIAIIAEGTYSAYWLQNERNVIVVSSITGHTDVWLNGSLIMDDENTAWSPANPVNFYIGAAYDGNFKFDGTIHRLQIFKTQLSAAEVQDISYNTTYRYRNTPTILLPFGIDQHDPSNVRTLDIANDAPEILVDGDMEDTGDPTLIWTPYYNATLTKETTNPHGGSQVLRVAYTNQTNPFVYQDILTVGKTYRITGWARGDGTAKPRIQEGLMGGSLFWEGTTSTSWQYFDFVGVPTHSWFILRTLIAEAGYCEFDDVSVTLYPQKASAQFGDGSTPTTYPTKLTDHHGYDYDGGDYLVVPATGLLNSVGVTFAIEFTPDFETDVDAWHYLYDSPTTRYVAIKANNINNNVLRIYLGNTRIVDIAEAIYSPLWRVRQRNILIVTGDSINNLTNAWLNGFQILTDDATAWTAANPTSLYIASSFTPSSYIDGKITHFAVFPRVLTRLQILDLQKTLSKRASKQ